MKKLIASLVKFSKPLYFIYYFIGSFMLKILKLFVKTEENLILFTSFGGKRFDDSPRKIYEEMIKDARFDNYNIVWAFQHPEEFIIPRGKAIRIDTIRYYVIALKARCWITNTRIERGLSFKGRNTFYFNTWHGTPIKKMGIDISKENKSFKSRDKWKVDLMTAQSKHEIEVFSRVFNIEEEAFVLSGLPRNDDLAGVSEIDKLNAVEKLGLPKDKKIILYAPTYREYIRDNSLNCVISPPINFSEWEQEIGGDYVVLLRAHYEVSKVLNVNLNSDFVIDVSSYPYLNDLMIASDLLVSDYSSIYFDYAILNKPMIVFAYDYEEYVSKRGLYFDIRNELVGGSINQKELLSIIKNLPSQDNLDLVKKFREKYTESYGEATSISLNLISKNLNY